MLLSGSALFGQWKAQTAETYDATYRIAYVTSTGGTETLRIMRNMSPAAKEKGASPYDQMSGEIMLNKNIGEANKVESIVFSFDGSPKIYIHRPAGGKQAWDPNVRKYIIGSDWQIWRIADSRDKTVKKIPADLTQLPESERTGIKGMLDMMKAGKKISCQIILLNTAYNTQSVIKCDFTLANSSKSIGYLLK